MNILELIDKLKSLYPEADFSIPPNLEFGILATNYAFLEAKKQRKNPKDIALEFADELNQTFTSYAIKAIAKVAGPYVNVDLTDSAWAKLTQSKKLLSLRKESKKVMVEFFSPNIAKKMHVGHMRSANLGESIRRVLKLKYKEVVSNNHLGDWGVQFSYIIWGIENEYAGLVLPEVEKMIAQYKPDDQNKTNYSGFNNINQLIDELYKLYVEVNKIVSEDEKVETEVKNIARILEGGLRGEALDPVEKERFEKASAYYSQIVTVSLVEFREAQDYLNLNKGAEYNYDKNKILNSFGNWSGTSLWSSKFDYILGESFYNKYLDEIGKWEGLITRDGESIFVDLEKENLGRCYLFSSNGYSLYATRDILARFVWSGVVGCDKMLSFADNRQSHSFKQVFEVVNRIIDKGYYNDTNFGDFGKSETQDAISKLSKEEALEHVGFGHLNLPEGAMSTRKGKIFEFAKLQQMLSEGIKKTLSEKNYNENIDEQKVNKLAVATLKWADLHRDREQDSIFDVNQFLKFEGNTGIYQLYTFARLNSILKNEKNNDLEYASFDYSVLNEGELKILKKTYTLPFILEEVAKTYKPHLICNYLFELATEVNSWYSKNSVTKEQNLQRKQAMLGFCKLVKENIKFSLDLLAIETVDSL